MLKMFDCCLFAPTSHSSPAPIPSDRGFAPPFRPMSFDMHDNGGRSFRVELRGDDVCVWRLSYDESKGNHVLPAGEQPVWLCHRPARVFVGRSPRNAFTEFGGGHGPRFYGNSVLVEYPCEDDDGFGYAHIGRTVRRIDVPDGARVEWFMSPVGNNDVPYPYAVDSLGRTHLLVEGVTLDAKSAEEYGDDPYSYYYGMHLITPDLGRVPPRNPVIERFDGIESFFCGNEPYTLTYKPHATEGSARELIDRLGPMEVGDCSGLRRKLDEAAYVDLMRRFGKAAGFSAMRTAEEVGESLE